MNKETVEKFVAELTELSRKYGIVLGSCGCCSSIFMEDLLTSEHWKQDGKYNFEYKPSDQFHPDERFEELSWELNLKV